jgi:2-keto-4-pentenoate hydratase/2-oxohepta-3-ene-1,7-dioic acid hydratase in catechol pathway
LQLVTFERTRADARADHSMRDVALGFEALDETTPGSRRLGAILPAGPAAGAIVDLNRALAVKLASEDAGAPEAEADSLLPSGMLAFLRDGPRALEAARTAFDFASDALLRYDAPDLRRAGVVEDRRAVRLCAPVPRPGKVLGVARNYAAHAAERGAERPEEPVLFLKATSAVIGPEDEIVLPTACREVDYEGELAVVIGARARGLDPSSALACVAGFCVGNDVSARDFQNVRGQRFIGKSCDTFCPLGPALVTRDEIEDPQDLAIRTVVSGETLQSGGTKEMIFSIAEILAFASQLFTLEPGDVVLTGTPAGVGAARKPPRWLRDGDVVEVAVERVGRLRNFVRAAQSSGLSRTGARSSGT